MSDLAQLRQRLTVLGVDVKSEAPALRMPLQAASRNSNSVASNEPTSPLKPASSLTRAAGVGNVGTQQGLAVKLDHSRSNVTELIDRCGRAAAALHTAKTTTAAARRRTAAQLDTLSEGRACKVERVAGATRTKARVPLPRSARAPAAVHSAGQQAVAVAPLMPPPPPALGAQHTRPAVPHTPLSSVLQQYKEAETNWAHEKAQLRREAVLQRKRALQVEQDFQRLSRQLEHHALDVAALKAALKTRDDQLHEAHETLRKREEAFVASQAETSNRIVALTHEREDLKALLLATLQRLEAVDEVVHRADVTSSVMEQKVAALEEERLRALEAAARARAEVQDLSENRRRLAWQSKLLEKMSEMQLKHNKQKTEAIKSMLDADSATGAARGGVTFQPSPRHVHADREGWEEEDDLASDLAVEAAENRTAYRAAAHQG